MSRFPSPVPKKSASDSDGSIKRVVTTTTDRPATWRNAPETGRRDGSDVVGWELEQCEFLRLVIAQESIAGRHGIRLAV